MSELDVSVAVCTWNRASLLDEALGALALLEVPAGLRWELLVVNNGSTDDTDRVLTRHAEGLPLRRLFEAEPGVARARNRALDDARGELLLWCDDDVRVSPGWLREHHRAARDFSDVSFLGGPIEPSFTVEPPPWARDPSVIEGPFAALDLGPEVRRMRPGEVPYGANMGFRRSVLDGVRFDTRLGRVGTWLGGGEETSLVATLIEQGRTGVWVGPARVRHRIGPDRLTGDYLWSYHYGRGRTLLHCDASNDGLQLAGVPWRWMLRAATARLRARWLAPGSTPRWARALEEAAFTTGKIARLRHGLEAHPGGGGA